MWEVTSRICSKLPVLLLWRSVSELERRLRALQWEGWRGESCPTGLQQPRVVELYGRGLGSWGVLLGMPHARFVMESPTHQHREDQSHEPTTANSEGHHVGHEPREGGGQGTEQVGDTAEDKVSHMVVILLGPVLVGDPAREQLADGLRDAWGEEEFSRAAEKTWVFMVFFYFALHRSDIPNPTCCWLEEHDHKGLKRREVTGKRF